jgi:hypothetical protein
MAVDWDAMVLGPTIEVFGEDQDKRPIYTASDALPVEIDGVFDEAYREVDLVDTGTGANTVMPVLGVRLVQFVRPPRQGELITVPKVGKTYVIKDVRPDGHGWAKLMLGVKKTP